MASNKKVLLITYFFPPLNNISSLRTYSFAKYLKNFEFDVTVFTVKKNESKNDLSISIDKNEIEIINVSNVPIEEEKETAQSSDKKNEAVSQAFQGIKFFKRKIFGNLFSSLDKWYFKAIQKAETFNYFTDFDILISSQSPISSHLIAKKIKANNPNIYWVADYRDLWYNNHFGMKPLFPLSSFQCLVEKSINQSADCLSTVSKPLKEELLIRGNDSVILLENGYFEENVNLQNATQSYDELIDIVYTGVFYPEKYDTTALATAIGNLIGNGILRKDQVRIQFFGENSEFAKRLTLANGLNEEIVEAYERISHEEAIAKQHSAAILLFIGYDAPETRGVLTGKLFEYLVANRPILGLGISHENAAGKLILESNTGYVCGNDVNKIEAAVKEIIQGKSFRPNRDVILNYRRDKIIARLAEHLNGQFPR